MTTLEISKLIDNQNPSANSTTSIISATLSIQSTTLNESTTNTNQPASSHELWAVEVTAYSCSDESKTYAETMEKSLTGANFLEQDSNPCRYYIACSRELKNEEEVLNYIIESFDDIGFSTQIKT